jgi:glutaredoxin 3
VACSGQREHDESADHRLLVVNLTVVSRGERVFSSHGIAFTAKNVAEDTASREDLLARTGRMAVPVITVDDEVVVGFDRGRLQRLLGIK